MSVPNFICNCTCDYDKMGVIYEPYFKRAEYQKDKCLTLAEAITRAIDESIEKGIYAKLYELVARQIVQGKTVEEIAEVFGEPVEVIRKIAGDVESTDR